METDYKASFGALTDRYSQIPIKMMQTARQKMELPIY